MDAATMMEILKTEYGISSMEELNEAAANFSGIGLGIFTEPLDMGGKKNAEGISERKLALA